MKARTKRFLQKTLLNSDPQDALIVASMGRSGSTLVFDSLTAGITQSQGSIPSRLHEKLQRDVAWDLSDFEPQRGVVYKTHDLPSSLQHTQKIRAIFIYGNPVDAVLSVYAGAEKFGMDWIEQHFRHLRADGDYTGLLKSDVLGFERQIREWTEETRFPVLCIKYDVLWDCVEDLSDFVGFSVQLPERKPRAEKQIDPSVLEAAEALYSDLKEHAEGLSDVFVTTQNHLPSSRLK